MTPERKRQLIAELEEITGLRRKRQRPKVVASDGAIVRDADVVISPKDPNSGSGKPETISVRRSDYVTVNMRAYEEQKAERAMERLRRRSLDPCRLALYGEIDDDE